MIDQVAGAAGDSFGQALAAGAEGAAGWVLAAALSPVGLMVMGAALVVALWKGRR